MERLNLLSVALGLACLAGINLYLTVFVTGLAINQHWIALSPAYQSLNALGHPMIITIAGILFFLQFFADKIPWIDTAWDTVHTIIRPIGGALLAIQVLGHSSPTMTVLIALLAGSTSLVAHTAKASSRLVANSSPEPFTNIGLSLAEDAGVFGGLALLHYNPVLALGLFASALLAFFYFAPRILRAMKARIWFAMTKLRGPADINTPVTLPITLKSKLAEVFSRQNVLSETIAWAVPCVSGRGRRIPPNLFGALIATNEEPRKVTFVARKGGRGFCQTIDLDGTTVAREPNYVSENLVIVPRAGKGAKYAFLFTRSRGALVEHLAEYLREKVNAEPLLPQPDVRAPFATA